MAEGRDRVVTELMERLSDTEDVESLRLGLQRKDNELKIMRQRMEALELQNAELVRHQRAQHVVEPSNKDGSEHSIVEAQASVIVYDADKNRWVPSGSSPGLSKVHIYHHDVNNTFRVVGTKLQDHEEVINCAILKGLKYNQATPTFHQWRNNRQVYGLNFSVKEEAEDFAQAMRTTIEYLSTTKTLESKTADSPTTLLELSTDGLSHISERQWKRKSSSRISLQFIHTVHMIKGEIWICADQNIHIFDTELSHLKMIKLDKDWVYDMTELTSSDVIVATEGGLYHISSEGKELADIDTGRFTGVAFYNGVLYAALGGEIRMYKEGTNWKQTCSIKLNCQRGKIITLSVNNSGVYVCYPHEARVDIVSHTGELKLSHDLTYGKKKEDVSPMISSVDESGNMLITDRRSGSVSVLSGEGQKRVVTLEPPLKWPMCALLYRDRLYVTDWETDCVILYS